MGSTLCPHCREEISRTALRCPHCGARIPGEPDYTPDSLIAQLQSVLAGTYKIRREIGKGGMAVVYEAEDVSLERRVAMKFLLPEFAQDDEVLERFRREAVVASKLDHPAIVPIYNIGRADRFWYIVMKFVDGENLKHNLQRKGKFSIQEVTTLLSPIAKALDYAHENGVIHRDIKSSNFLISRSGRPYLTDFGIAKAVDSMQVTRTGSIVGTPEYMSPEQADGRVCDHRADLYSLGVVVYELLLGRPPFKGETPFATALKHIHEEVDFPGGTPSDLIAVLRKGLAKSPAKRYQTAVALVRDLEKLSGTAVPVEEDTTPGSRRIADRDRTPKRATVEVRETPVRKEEPRSPTPRPKKRKNFVLPLVAALIIVIFIMLLIPETPTKNPKGGANVATVTTVKSDSSRVGRAIAPDTARNFSLKPPRPEKKQDTIGGQRPIPPPRDVPGAQSKGEIILSISSSAPSSAGLRAYIIPSVDAQYGAIELVKDAGNNILKVGDKLANGTDLEMTSAEYVVRSAVVKDLHLPSEVKFPRTGGYIIVVLGPEKEGGGRDIRGAKAFYADTDGHVANFDGMESSGNRNIFSFVIEN